jgi:hypothetical protein
MSRSDGRPRARVLPACLWAAAIAAALVGIDLAERFAFYEIRPRDRSSLARAARRPIKDTGLALLHGFAGELDLAGLPEGIAVFDFHLKPRDEERLLAHLTRVRVTGTHDELSRGSIPARMRVEGHTYDVRLKLRGRQHYHVVPPRPSLRVSLRRGRSYRGTRDLNLIEPFDKTADQVFLWEAREHGLIEWDSTLGILAVDGRPLSVVHYVEQVRRETGDHALRPEGMFFRGTGERYSEGTDPARCGALVERASSWLADPGTTVPFEAMEEVLDLERFRWFTALTELSGDGHGFAHFNMKGYCDPVSPRLEFLTWDTRFGDWERLPTSQFAEHGTQFLRDDRYRALHDGALYALARDRVEPMLARMRAFDDAYAALLSRDPLFWFPRGGPDGGFMRRRPEKLARTLRSNARAVLAALEGDRLAFWVDAQRRELLLATPDRGAKRLEALELRTAAGPSRRELPDPGLVYGRYRDRQPVVAVALPEDVDPAAIAGVVAANVHTGRRAAAERASARLAGERVRPPRAAAPELPPLPAGFRASREERRIRVGPGVARFDGVLRLPRGFALEVAPGTTLLAGPAALLEVQGDLAMRGRPEAPIAVRGATAEPWGALAVVGARGRRARVEIAFTTIRGGTGSSAGATNYTGSLAIYHADVRLDHLAMEESAGEDALNLKYASVHATDNRFRGGASDAVDYDFVTGVDLRTRVEDFGNDGIDISASTLRIEGARIRDARDKGLSLGEASTPAIVDVEVSGARIGCAVKDRADARVDRLTVARSAAAVALYTKKPSFGPSRAAFTQLVAVDVGAFAILDHGSQVRFEDAVRIGDAEPPMREFAGVENVLHPGLAALPLRKLHALAAQARAGPRAESPALARAAPGYGQGGAPAQARPEGPGGLPKERAKGSTSGTPIVPSEPRSTAGS